MNALAGKRCLHHGSREAVALCPGCRNFFCRECVTEHGGRVMCAACLAAAAAETAVGRGRGAAASVLVAALSFVVLWACFFGLGRALLELPDSFHRGTIWSPEEPGR